MSSRCSPASSSRPRICGAITARSGSVPSVDWATILSRSHTHGAETVAGLSVPEGQDEMTEERITRVTLEQARKMKGLTDWVRLDAMTEEEIERNAAEDPDNPPWTDEDWANAQRVDPQKHTPVRLDRAIFAWFKEQGPDFQGRITAALRDFTEAQKQQRCRPPLNASLPDAPSRRRA